MWPFRLTKRLTERFTKNPTEAQIYISDCSVEIDFQELRQRHSVLKAILAPSLSPCVLLPQSAANLQPSEMAEYTQHFCNRIYGAQSANWSWKTIRQNCTKSTILLGSLLPAEPSNNFAVIESELFALIHEKQGKPPGWFATWDEKVIQTARLEQHELSSIHTWPWTPKYPLEHCVKSYIHAHATLAKLTLPNTFTIECSNQGNRFSHEICTG